MNGHYLYDRKRSSSFNLIVGIHKAKTPHLSGPKCYQIKMFKLGDIYEIYKYELPVYAGYHKFKNMNKKNTNEKTKKENRKKVVTRIRNNIRRLAIANFNEYSRFFTATFKDNITGMDYANNEFKKFIKRIKYKYRDFKYLAVVEFQKRGAIHYHMLSDFDYIEHSELEKIWGNGFVWIKDLLTGKKGKPVDNVGAYIVKYMNKKNIDKRLMGKKAYFTSRNLARPEIAYENIGLNECFEKYDLSKNNMVFNNRFMSKENGVVDYFEFNKKRELL
ncbi:MAG: Rep protein [Actinobacteria bacterium]|nr:MAG: Rep protein [Actinomycetota bacterium]